MTYLDPLTRHVSLEDGSIPDAHAVQRRRLSDRAGLFVDREAERALLRGDPLVYEVHEAADLPKEDGHLLFSTTVLRPGRVGGARWRRARTPSPWRAWRTCGRSGREGGGPAAARSALARPRVRSASAGSARGRSASAGSARGRAVAPL
jgi:hypothetical protein